MIVGGGNAAGYAARTFVEQGMADGRLAIVSKEVMKFSSFLHILFGYCYHNVKLKYQTQNQKCEVGSENLVCCMNT